MYTVCRVVYGDAAKHLMCCARMYPDRSLSDRRVERPIDDAIRLRGYKCVLETTATSQTSTLTLFVPSALSIFYLYVVCAFVDQVIS